MWRRWQQRRREFHTHAHPCANTNALSDANADADPRANTIAGDPPSADCEPPAAASK